MISVCANFLKSSLPGQWNNEIWHISRPLSGRWQSFDQLACRKVWFFLYSPHRRYNGICWNKRNFWRNSMSFHIFSCNSMPTLLDGSRRFLLYDYLSVISKRFYASVIYIMSQSPHSYQRIDTLSPSASTSYRSWSIIKHPDTYLSFFFSCYL